MKSQSVSLTLTAVAVLGMTVCGVAADKRKKQKPKSAAASFGKPGKAQAHFRRLVGRWNCDVKVFINPAKPTTSKGSAVIRLLHGGRHLQERFRGTMHGAPFQGMGLKGYDNAKKKYVGSWIDNHNTGIMPVEGTYDPKTQTLTEIGNSSSPMGPMKLKMVSKYLSNDKFTFTMFMLASGGEQKLMEITYMRAKRKAKKSKKRD